MTKNPVNVQIGKNIRAQRNALGLTLPVLAAKMELPHQQIQGYETARIGLSASMAYRIAAALEIDVQRFYDDLEFHPEIKQALEVNWSSIRGAEALSRVKDPELRDILTALSRKLRDGHF